MATVGRYIRRVLAWLPPGVELMRDISAASWVGERLRPWDPDGARLWSFAPEGFDAYARIFHSPGAQPGGHGVPRRVVTTKWADLARARGVKLTPDIGFAEVSGLEPGDRAAHGVQPLEGELSPELCDALAATLRRHTSTPDLCWFCLWEGNGAFWSQAHASLVGADTASEEIAGERGAGRKQDEILRATPRVESYARSYFLFRGPLDAVGRFEPDGWHTSPNLWWPDDRQWIVVTEVDGFSTYVGGGRRAIDHILQSPRAEAIEVTPDTHMDPGPYRPRWR